VSADPALDVTLGELLLDMPLDELLQAVRTITGTATPTASAATRLTLAPAMDPPIWLKIASDR
jgi:hypothetical protein